MKFKYILLSVISTVFFTGCEKLLDRPPLTSYNDENGWSSEANVRLYANKYYTTFFHGFNAGLYSAPLTGYTLSDDVFSAQKNQSNFAVAVPPSAIWDYNIIRSTNIMLDRISNKMAGVMNQEATNHWLGIGRFFRAMKFADLVFDYGDVPFYDMVPADNDPVSLYKPRDARDVVMNAVYDDLEFALQNVRLNDGAQNVNRYVVAAYISRIALHEATWQKYYYNNDQQSRKFLDLAIKAGDMVISSNRYDIVTDYKSLFTSNDLKGNRDCIFYRAYDASLNVKHGVASNSNYQTSINIGPTTDLIKAYICVDGEAWQNSTELNAADFSLQSIIKTRDSRLEATFYKAPTFMGKSSLWFVNKFFPRYGEKAIEESGTAPAELRGTENVTDYPVMRYSEVLLNWIEAKAESASLGGGAVTQSDIEKTINKIRNRPLAEEAIAKGVKKTAGMQIGSLPNDPDRDPSVSSLLWEIRRERRMEFTFEYSRIADLKRWKKLEYMDTQSNPDLISGGWVDLSATTNVISFPAALSNSDGVANTSGQRTYYNGTNAGNMKGFYINKNYGERLPFLNIPNVNPYLKPVGFNQINDYSIMGYILKQTEGWPQEN